MPDESFDLALDFLRRRTGRTVVVSVGAADAEPPLAAILEGELSAPTVVGGGIEAGVGDSSSLLVDAAALRWARVSGDTLSLAVGGIAVEVGPLPDEPRFLRP